MGPASSSYHHGDLRNALIREACRLVREAGAERFSLREAARSAGVSANAAYRHFTDKSDLLSAVAAQGSQRLARRMLREQKAVTATRPPRGLAVERFKATGRAYVKFAVQNPELFRLMFGAIGPRAAAERDDTSTPGPYELLGAALDELLEDGLMTPEQRTGAESKAWAVVHGFASLLIEGAIALRSSSERAPVLEALLEFAVAGLCQPQALSPSALPR